jgi:hypothetical protein
MQGSGLSFADKVMVLDTCTHPSVYPQSVLAGSVFQVSLNGTVVSLGELSSSFATVPAPNVSGNGSRGGYSNRTFGYPIVTAPGGTYRLCWCMGLPAFSALDSVNASSIAPRCVLEEGVIIKGSFQVDAGTLTIVGPSFHQHRTCVSGHLCSVDSVTGLHLSAGDNMMILDTCGKDKSVIPKFSAGGFLVEITGRSGAGIFSSLQQVSSAGGEYRMCWCGQGFPCSQAADFVTDAGTLTLIGPTSLSQHKTCISGQTCALSDIHGNHFTSLDVVAILDTCAQQAVPARFADMGLFRSFAVAGAETVWKQVPVTAAGGQYRLCWCSGSTFINSTFFNFGIDSRNTTTNSSVCSNIEEFVTDFGEMTLIGVSPLEQDRTCVSGQTCAFDGILGQDLSLQDRAMILDTCGFSQVIDRSLGIGTFDRYGFWHHNNKTYGNISRHTLTWGPTPLTATGGLYRLCWCHIGVASASSNSTVAEDCVVNEQFRVDGGSLNLIGVSPLFQDRTCVSGLTCQFDELQGFHTSLHDSIAVLETCGALEDVPRFSTTAQRDIQRLKVNTTHRFVSSAGGTYRLCWCAANFLCSIAEDFRVHLGELLLIGPSPLQQQRTCVSGRPCTVAGILGAGLTQADRVLVLDTCGVVSSVPRFPSGGLSTLVSSNQTTGPLLTSWGLTSITASAGTYRLCWCSGSPSIDGSDSFGSDLCAEALRSLTTPILPNASTTSENVSTELTNSVNFIVDAGSLTLRGVSPLQQDRTCVSGQTCSLDGITGQDLAQGDAILFLDTCGATFMEVRKAFIATNNVSTTADLVAGANYAAAWGAVNISAPGGQYRLCWCGGHDHACTMPVEFEVDFGRMMIIGPSPLAQAHTCVSGQTCVVEGVMGTGLSDHSRILVLDVCGTNTIVPNFGDSGIVSNVLASGATVSWGSAAVTAAGGQYRLCWCASVSMACSLAEQFRTDAGNLMILGPSPLSQDSTCVSGRTCTLGGIIGVDLGSLNGGSVMTLSTCGTDSVSDPSFPIRDYTAGNGSAVIAATVRQSVFSGTATVSWGSVAVTAPGGQYRLCWCAAHFDCLRGNSHKTDM